MPAQWRERRGRGTARAEARVFSSWGYLLLLLHNQVDHDAGQQGKHDDKGQIEQKAPDAEDDFQRAEVGNLCRGSREHKGGGAADAHPLPEPFLQKRDRPAAAGIERYAHRRGHEYAPGFIPAEERGHLLLGDIALKDGREQDAEEEIRPRGLDVAPDIQQIADQDVGVGVMICALFKAGEIEEAFAAIKGIDQQSRRAAAEKAGHDAHRQYRRPQGGAVDDELGIEEDRGHHERGQPVMAHALFGKGRRDGDGAVHTKGRGDPQKAGGDDAEEAPGLSLHPAEKPVDAVFGKDRDKGADGDAEHPIPENLPQLNIKIIPEINKLPAQDTHDFVQNAVCPPTTRAALGRELSPRLPLPCVL